MKGKYIRLMNEEYSASNMPTGLICAACRNDYPFHVETCIEKRYWLKPKDTEAASVKEER